MRAPTFTPGPYKTGDRINGDIDITAGPDAAPLATVYGDDSDSQCWPVTANANLLKAAPELYAACQLLVDRFDGAQPHELAEAIAEDPSLLLDCFNRAVSALASAQGGTP